MNRSCKTCVHAGCGNAVYTLCTNRAAMRFLGANSDTFAIQSGWYVDHDVGSMCPHYDGLETGPTPPAREVTDGQV